MPNRLDPLPLEGRAAAASSSGDLPKLNAVAVVTHIGPCIAVLALPIYLAWMFVKVEPQLALFQRTTAVIGVAAMACLPVLCIGGMLRQRWARSGLLAYAAVEMFWETAKLLLTVFYYAPIYKRLMNDALAQQMAAATQAASRPTQFDSFVNYGIYIMAVLVWLIFGGYALGAWKAMRSESADAVFGQR